MIEVRQISKSYGGTKAVDRLEFTVRPGAVTGFLGPNGAGKSTTMRLIVGLDAPDAGEALVAGHRYVDFKTPLREVGALLDARAAHPGRSARAHLLALSATNRISRRRVEEVIGLVGLSEVADRRVGGFSLGMSQRLGLAAALLGDPGVLLLDEPVNGLDPDGIRWIRGLMRGLASEGRTVLISSHLMSEMALTADHLVVLGRGRLIADLSMEELTASATGAVRVVSPQAAELVSLVAARPSVQILSPEPGVLSVTGMSNTEVAELACAHGIVLHELTPVHASLEDAYLALTRDDVEYTTRTFTAPGRAAA